MVRVSGMRAAPQRQQATTSRCCLKNFLPVLGLLVVLVVLSFPFRSELEVSNEPFDVTMFHSSSSRARIIVVDEVKPSGEEKLPAEARSPRRASFVCINGQLERLELENKVQMLLEPIREDIGGTIDIALIVTENQAVYTKAQISTERAQHEPAFTKYQDAVAYLTNLGFNVVTTEPVGHAEDPTVYREYLQRLAQTASDANLQDPEFFAYDKRRGQNHVRQAISGELCYRQMVATGKDYSQGIVARWRDDVGFRRRLPIAKFHEMLRNPPVVDEQVDLGVVRKGQNWRPTMVTPYCRNWQGLNDRGAFVHPDGAYPYFMASIAAFTRALPLPSDRVCNHERFLRHIYNLEGFIFIPERDLYPIPMFRINGQGVFRSEEKSRRLCRVWWKSYRPDCPRQDENIELLDGTSKAPQVTEVSMIGTTTESNAQYSLPSPIRSFVCINGQLERLELDNKVETLLNPIREDIGGSVDIALVVTDNKALYTKAVVSEQRAQHQPAFSKFDEAFEYLTSRGFNVVTREPSPHAVDPEVYIEYQQRLAQTANDKSLKTPELFAYNKKRAQNHVRQAISWEECYRHMRGTGQDYSRGIVARWRDDVGFEKPLDITQFHQWLLDPTPIKEQDDFGAKKSWRPTMVTPHCRNWNGLNDRGAFVHMDGAYPYFMAPLIAFSRAKPLPPSRVCNYERFLRYVYNEEGFHYIPTKQLYPVPMFNNNGTGVFREEELHSSMCMSFWNSWTQNCSRANETIQILTKPL